MNKIFVIGDIHGCYNTFKNLIFNVLKVNINDKIILLGDLIDRGPFIKETVELILEMQKKHYDIIVIRGNHEQLLIDSINSPKSMYLWLKNGGETTLDSFCIINPGFLDEEIIRFFYSTKLYHIEDKYLCVHAGLNFEIDEPLKDINYMLNSRISKVIPKKIGDRKLITGHTPKTLEEIKLSLDTNHIYLDGGCVYKNKVKGLGYLVALELHSKELFFTENIDF